MSFLWLKAVSYLLEHTMPLVNPDELAMPIFSIMMGWAFSRAEEEDVGLGPMVGGVSVIPDCAKE